MTPFRYRVARILDKHFSLHSRPLLANPISTYVIEERPFPMHFIPRVNLGETVLLDDVAVLFSREAWTNLALADILIEALPYGIFGSSPE